MHEEVPRNHVSDSFAILLLAFGIAGFSFVLDVLADEGMAVFEDLLPTGTELPRLTELILTLPFLGIGGGLAVVVAGVALTVRRTGWIHRHLALIMSLSWFALSLCATISLAGLFLPLLSVTLKMAGP